MSSLEAKKVFFFASMELALDIGKYKCVCMLSHVRLFVSPQTVTCQAPLPTDFPRQEYWSGLPFSPPGDLPNPGTESTSPASPALAGGFFTTVPLGKPRKC